ncbi:hypothetical protein [Chondromyces apiculatus]|uniref:OmpA-like domain-containing protein n=1 Tax=Chondromyces apiculatus DSM 436 TaxID=1192034 RepID=A0A017T582_9BACT|nr:hypothetical protein [Chondromyces apiculatus]EYF03965.1 Hypothetical protein CAP_5066 [Chondromyces apiculatus DSM 436]
MKAQLFGVAFSATLLAACAPIPPPSVLGEVEQVRRGAAAQDARRYAPTAFAHAEKLRVDARRAHEEEDPAGAQILGEQALAAYTRAHVLSRLAHADEVQADARETRATSQAELARVEADQVRAAAELDAVEMKVKVAREAQAVMPSGKADPEREKARVEAAKSLALQARTLCAGARLLLGNAGPGTEPAAGAGGAGQAALAAGSRGAGTPAAPRGGLPAAVTSDLTAQVAEASAAVDKLDAALMAAASASPIDEASRVRARCLKVLTAVRQAGMPVAAGPGGGDVLLKEIAAAPGWDPIRDDRGVVVTLRGLFGKDASLTPAGEKRLQELARFAVSHPEFPLTAVLHADREPSPKEQATWKARADALVRVLGAAQVQHVETVLAGARVPVADPTGPTRSRNARVEIVFVSPRLF